MSKQHNTKGKRIVRLVILVLAFIYWPITVPFGVLYLFYKKHALYSTSNSRKETTFHSTCKPSFSPNVQPRDTSEKPHYSPKDSFMTDCEKQFFAAFLEIVGNKYIVQPQINLASVVNKDTYSKYRNELFRNIDFGIFNKEYKLLLLIEINDKTHTQKARQERDTNVRNICNDAKIPLVTFWTKYGIDKVYIKNVFEMHLHDSFTSSSTNEPSSPTPPQT